MDTKLKDGDFQLDARGIPLPVTGAEAIIQQAMIALVTRRGSFAPLPNLGSRLYQLPRAESDTLNRLALAYVQEALLALPQFRVQEVQCQYDVGQDQLSLLITALVSDNRYRVAVAL